MKTIAVYLTGACNLRCKHCSVGLDQYNVRESLSDDEILIVLDRASERDVEYVTFLGGEPTYGNHDLERICKHAEKINLKLSFNTNLTNFEKIKRILSFRSVKNIVVSLDGASADTHDKMRGKGMFARTLNNLNKLVEERNSNRTDLTVDITFALSQINKCDSIGIVQKAIEIDVDCLNINIVQPIGRAKKFSDTIQGSDESYLKAIAEIISYFILVKPKIKLSIPLPPLVAKFIEKEYNVPAEYFENYSMCGGTSVYTYVDLRGNLLPCPGLSFEEGRNEQMNKKHGNLQLSKRSIKEIETSSLFKSFELHRKAKTKNKLFEPCNSCKYQNTCSPCTTSFYKKSESNTIFLCNLVKKLSDSKDLCNHEIL